MTIITAVATGRLGKLPVRTDVRTLALDRKFELVIAPMQILQILGGPGSRQVALHRVAHHLVRGGRLAAAITERPAVAASEVVGAAIPDMTEIESSKGEWFDRWIYSSLPVAMSHEAGHLEIHRFRRTVSPDGALAEEEHVDRLEALDADQLEAEAKTAGLTPVERLEVPSTGGYLGSTIVVLGAG